MPSGHDCLVNRMVWLWVAVTFFLVKSNKAQIGRDDLVSVHHAIVLPANNSAEDADNSFISLKEMSCRSLDEFIPGSIAVPSPSSTCVYGPVWNGEKPREIHLPLKTAQPYGCKATVSCVTPVRNSLVANILFCDKNGNWVPNEYEIAMGRSLLPDCQSAIEMEEELDEKLKPSRGNQFWNEAPQAHDQQQPDVNFGFDSDEFQKTKNPSATVGYGHPMHSGTTIIAPRDALAESDCVPIDDSDQPWIVTYTLGPSGRIRIGDSAEYKCRDDNYSIKKGEIRTCLPGGGWNILEEPECVPKGCPTPLQTNELTASYVNCDGVESKRCHIGSDNLFVRPGVMVMYECSDKESQYIKGEYLLHCVETTSGYEWNPPRWPTCEPKKNCAVPLQFTNGFFDVGPGQSVGIGHVATLMCHPGFRLEGDSYFKCLQTGEWENLKPSRCVSTEVDYTSNRFIAMTAIGGLLGLLLIVLLIFLVQRHLWLRKSRVSRRRLIDPPMDPRLAAVVAAHPLSDPDRLALIAFADGLQVPLPSYDEAVSQAISQRRNGPPPFDAISTLSGYANRALRRLPSLSSLRSRDTVPPMRPLRETGDPYSAGDISHMSHNATSDGRPAGSSVETMAVSDVSTAVTAETLSSSGTQSTTPSCRANAGSLTESIGSLHGLHGGIGHLAERTHSISPLGSSTGGSLDSRSAGGGADIEFAPLLEEEQPVARSDPVVRST